MLSQKLLKLAEEDLNDLKSFCNVNEDFLKGFEQGILKIEKFLISDENFSANQIAIVIRAYQRALKKIDK